MDLSDGQELLLVLCLVYLSDCFCWVRKNAVLFTAPFCRRWRLAKAPAFMGNARGALALLNPLPPFGEAFLAPCSRISLSPEGVCDFTLGSVPGVGRMAFSKAAYRFEEIERVRCEGADLVLNRTVFASCLSAAEAEALAKLIGHLRTHPVGQRAETIRRYFKGRLHKGKGARAVKRARLAAEPLRFFCQPLFVLVYAGLPGVAIYFGLLPVLISCALVLFLSGFIVSTQYFLVHRKLFPAGFGERLGHAIKMCGCPPLAFRAADHLTLHAVTEFHPLLLADVLQAPELRAFSAAFVRDLRHPLRHGLIEPAALGIAEWHARAELEVCLGYLQAAKILSADSVFAEPARQEDCTKYCPRCEVQLRTGSLECPECPGVALETFAAAPASEKP